MRITVVIPHLNQPVPLARCLASLAAGHRQPDEIIVVDNGSTELPVTAYCGDLQIRLLRQPVPGPGPARNLGVAAAGGDVLAFIDADCLASAEWLAAAEVALAVSGAAILGGDVRIAVANPVRMTALEAYESIYAYRMDRYITREGFTGTGNLVVRRAVLDQVGPFAGLEVAEDRDWGRRATAAGFAIHYVPKMLVYHPARPDFASLCRKWDRHVAHDFVAARDRRGGRLWFLVKTLAMGLSPLAEVSQILVSDRISGAGTRLRAFLCLTRIRFYRARRMAWLLAGGNPSTLSGTWNRG